MYSKSDDKKTYNGIIYRLQQTLPNVEFTRENYITLFCDLILTGSSDLLPNVTLAQLSQHKPLNQVKAKLYQALYQLMGKSGYRHVNSISPIVDILLWGYEIKMNGKKTISLLSVNLFEFKEEQLIAFWEAIQFSQAESITGLHGFELLCEESVAQAGPAGLTISCKGIANSHLTCFSWNKDRLHIPRFQLSTSQWRLFWESINLAKLKTLDLANLKLPDENFDEFWDILCQGITESALTSLDFSWIMLENLNATHWLKLYKALDKIQLESFDLSGCCIKIANDTEIEDRDNAFSTLCKILKLASLKQLRLRGVDFEPAFFPKFCQALAKSAIKDLEFSLDKINVEDLSPFINTMDTMSLQSLSLHCRGIKKTFFEQLCQQVDKSKITAFSIQAGKLNLDPNQGQLLARSFKQRGIKVFDSGWVNLNSDGFYDFLVLSGVEVLCLSNHLYGEHDNLKRLTTHLKNSAVSRLVLKSKDFAYEDIWEAFNGLITTIPLKELQCQIQYIDELADESFESLCRTIQESKLESLDLGFDSSLAKMKIGQFQVLFEAIRRSKINHLAFDLSLISILDQEKVEIVLSTLNVVEARSCHKGTLFGLCASTLFWQCNAQLTENSIRYNTSEGEKVVELDSGDIEILSPFV